VQIELLGSEDGHRC